MIDQPPHSAPETVEVVSLMDLPAFLLRLYELMDDQTLHKLWLQRHRWLTKKDVATLTGFRMRKVDELVSRRLIKMWRAPDSDEWRITWDEWRRDEATLVREGLLPKNLRPRHRGKRRQNG